MCDARFEAILSKFPLGFYSNLVGSLTWTERISGIDIFFSVSVLEKSSNEVHVAVSATICGQSVNSTTGTLNVEVSNSYIVRE